MSELTLFGNSGPKLPTVTFKEVGDTAQGIITNLREVQQRDFYSKQPVFWVPGEPKPRAITVADGVLLQAGVIKPAMQLVIELNSEKVLFASGLLLKAIRDALKTAGASAPEIGGALGVRFSSEKPTAAQPLKVFTAKYQKPE